VTTGDDFQRIKKLIVAYFMVLSQNYLEKRLKYNKRLLQHLTLDLVFALLGCYAA